LQCVTRYLPSTRNGLSDGTAPKKSSLSKAQESGSHHSTVIAQAKQKRLEERQREREKELRRRNLPEDEGTTERRNEDSGLSHQIVEKEKGQRITNSPKDGGSFDKMIEGSELSQQYFERKLGNQPPTL
jgi:hypothetical protein